VFPGHDDEASASRAFDPPAAFGAAPAPRAPTAPLDTDAALRTALATLQRMSGTA
jgi:hypothetical protein